MHAYVWESLCPGNLLVVAESEDAARTLAIAHVTGDGRAEADQHYDVQYLSCPPDRVEAVPGAFWVGFVDVS